MTTAFAPAHLMRGRTAHTRFEPKRHSFNYAVTMIDIDVDQLTAADKMSSLFSVDRQNLVSLNTTKRGDLGKSSMSDWARGLFSRAGISTESCTIRLLTFPRTELFSFAPLSVWLLLDPEQHVRGLIYEVNNTFGERHSYVARADGNKDSQCVDKSFHVSPFFDVEGQYRFTISSNTERFDLLIENIVDDRRVHAASLLLERKPLSTWAIMKFVLSSPLSGVGVVLGIHWEALKLFIKGMKYRPKPSVPANDFSECWNSEEGLPTGRKQNV